MGVLAPRRPGRDGLIRLNDSSLERAGINQGDLVVVDLTNQPKQDELCVAFTAYGELVVRYFHEEDNGDIRLTTGPEGDIIQLFAPDAVMIFGRVSTTVPK